MNRRYSNTIANAIFLLIWIGRFPVSIRVGSSDDNASGVSATRSDEAIPSDKFATPTVPDGTAAGADGRLKIASRMICEHVNTGTINDINKAETHSRCR